MRIKPEDFLRVQFRIGKSVCDNELSATDDIDVIDFAIRKQIPMRVVKSPVYGSDRCPRCNDTITKSVHYCSQCGQKLEWRI